MKKQIMAGILGITFLTGAVCHAEEYNKLSRIANKGGAFEFITTGTNIVVQVTDSYGTRTLGPKEGFERTQFLALEKSLDPSLIAAVTCSALSGIIKSEAFIQSTAITGDLFGSASWARINGPLEFGEGIGLSLTLILIPTLADAYFIPDSMRKICLEVQQLKAKAKTTILSVQRLLLPENPDAREEANVKLSFELDRRGYWSLYDKIEDFWINTELARHHL